MARTMLRDVGGGRRGGNARFTISACCVLLMVAVLSGCDLTDPTSPNDPADLTGQTTNQTFVFTGTISVSSSAGTLPADDTSTVLLVVEVKDSSGAPIQNLTTVGFSTDLGAFNVGGVLFTAAQVTTFNGSAQILFQSTNRQAGTATVTASIGNVSSSSSITLEAAPFAGTIALAFGASGTGAVTLTGAASALVPFDANIGLTALDDDGDPIVGANVSLRIIEDTTADNTSNPNAEFTTSRHTTTGVDGSAVTILRAYGPGTVAVVADLFEPNTGALVATSNRIILTTTQVTPTLIATLTFSDGVTTNFPTSGPYPFTEGIIVRVTDAAGTPLAGLTVLFTIERDTTSAGATLSNSVVVTDGTGTATSVITIPDPGAVAILAKVVDSSNAAVLLATSNVIIITGS